MKNFRLYLFLFVLLILCVSCKEKETSTSIETSSVQNATIAETKTIEYSVEDADKYISDMCSNGSFSRDEISGNISIQYNSKLLPDYIKFLEKIRIENKDKYLKIISDRQIRLDKEATEKKKKDKEKANIQVKFERYMKNVWIWEFEDHMINNGFRKIDSGFRDTYQCGTQLFETWQGTYKGYTVTCDWTWADGDMGNHYYSVIVE